MADGLIPLGVKLALTFFFLVLVPIYWRSYGPTNFLYFWRVYVALLMVGMPIVFFLPVHLLFVKWFPAAP